LAGHHDELVLHGPHAADVPGLAGGHVARLRGRNAPEQRDATVPGVDVDGAGGNGTVGHVAELDLGRDPRIAHTRAARRLIVVDVPVAAAVAHVHAVAHVRAVVDLAHAGVVGVVVGQDFRGDVRDAG